MNFLIYEVILSYLLTYIPYALQSALIIHTVTHLVRTGNTFQSRLLYLIIIISRRRKSSVQPCFLLGNNVSELL